MSHETQQESSEPAVVQIERELEAMIVSGEYPPGAHINENALASRLGVSRAPVREACRLLERAGLVRIVPHQGAFVASLSLSEVVHLFDIRASLGRLAGEQAAAAIDGERLAALRELMAEMDAIAKLRDANRYIALNLEFHACLYEATGNTRLAALDRQLGNELRIYRRHGLAHGGGLLVSNQEHRMILDAIERGDRTEAGSRLAAHIEGGRDRFLRAMSATGQLILQEPEAEPRATRSRRARSK